MTTEIKMLRVDIINDGTGTTEIGNYCYEVVVTRINNGKVKLERIQTGRIEGHRRKLGWPQLLNRLLQQSAEGDTE